MKNVIGCPNCNASNNYYEMNCSQCGTILRSRVVNIDLWQSIWKMIESPKTAIQDIVYAEHKNFISLLAVLIGIKLFANSNFILNLTLPKLTSEFQIPLQLVISIALTILLLLTFSFIVKIVSPSLDVKTRFKDNLAIIIYTQIPILLGLLVFFPIEYGIFGGHWIYFNPSPFVIKAGSAYLLSGLELVFFLWQMILLTVGLYIQTSNFAFSIISSFVIEISLLAATGIIPALIVSLI